ncbi:Afadin and alpha-actinin-binding-domain-containing protein [Xylariaceae sp. FL0255]|nr:Afadin and alpha-actinin-binding-domain-containing protein [Xylariaceae sp. FL0255]
MIDSQNLKTASLYINNQLLSRGLLRDGQNIDFANPESGNGDAGLESTMGQIIGVVNDLILRRDRDAEHRESLSSTLRTLRADTQRQTTEIARQTDKLSETQRRLDIAESTERALRTQLKTAEQGIHRLKDEVSKMKTLVAQTRSSCANEVRKRDRQIDSLKKAVADAGRVRGGGKSRDVLSISVTGDFGYGAGEDGAPAGATENDGYSLRMETNEFLTELAKGLSEENEGLLTLVRRTVERLREMSGFDRVAEDGEAAVDGGLRPTRNPQDDLVIQAPQKSTEELAAELEAIVVHLKSILTNPSFVPIEEVEVRDEAIARLGAGLETMEARWKDAVHMIDGWRKRMTSNGKSVDLEDLNMGLALSPVQVRGVQETVASVPLMRLSCVQEEDEEEEVAEEEPSKPEEEERPRSPSPPESLHLVPAPGYEIDDQDESDSDSSIFQDEDLELEDFEAEEPNVQILQESLDSPPLPKPPQLSPLKDSYSSGNRGSNKMTACPKRERPGDFTTIVEENTWDLAGEEPAVGGRTDEEQVPPPVPAHTVNYSPEQQKSNSKTTNLSSPTHIQERPSSTASYNSPLFGKSGERPSQTQRKLFSKPSATETKEQTQKQPVTRPTTATTTGSATRNSGEETRRAASDPVGTGAVTTKTRTRSPVRQTTNASSTTTSSEHSAAPSTTATTSTSTSTTSSRLPRRPQQQQQQSPLNMATITAKLAASEREADAARVRAKLKAVRRQSGRVTVETAPAPSEAPSKEQKKTTVVSASEPTGAEDMDPVKKDMATTALPPPSRFNESVDELAAGDSDMQGLQDKAKRKRDRRTSKVASRRRSTLSPWELEGLISGNVGGIGGAGDG